MSNEIPNLDYVHGEPLRDALPRWRRWAERARAVNTQAWGRFSGRNQIIVNLPCPAPIPPPTPCH